jgi:N-terminal domain of reverse transcriptase
MTVPTHTSSPTATVAAGAGAVSRDAQQWHAIDWPKAHRIVRRLQARIVQATQQGRWGKVKALQRLLTHSYSGKVLAVRRVTENQGKNTPGVEHLAARPWRSEPAAPDACLTHQRNLFALDDGDDSPGARSMLWSRPRRAEE